MKKEIKKKEPKELNIELTYESIDSVKTTWKWKDDSVDDVGVINLVQFLQPKERIHFMNELWRVLKKGAKARIITPHWASVRAYGNLDMPYPPVVESWYFHLNAEHRKQDITIGKQDYKCDFDFTYGYGLHPTLITRNMEYQQHAVTFWKEAAQDLAVTLIKR